MAFKLFKSGMPLLNHLAVWQWASDLTLDHWHKIIIAVGVSVLKDWDNKLKVFSTVPTTVKNVVILMISMVIMIIVTVEVSHCNKAWDIH